MRRKIFGLPIWLILLVVAGYFFRKQLTPLWEKTKALFQKKTETIVVPDTSVTTLETLEKEAEKQTETISA